MSNVLVALWNYRSDRNYGSPAMGVVQQLQRLVEKVDQHLAVITPKCIETRNEFHAIFVAPEYLFVGHHHNKGKRRPMRQKTRDEVIEALKGISKVHPKILIIAGSMFSRERLDDKNNPVPKLNFQRSMIGAEIRYGNYQSGNMPDTVTYAKGTAIAQPNPNAGLHKNFDLDGWTTSAGKRVPGIHAIANANPVYRAYNELYAFLAGRSVITPYQKREDFQECDGANPDKIAFVPGTATGLRTIAGFDFGFEICLDHATNALKGKRADFHIVVSDWTDTEPLQNVGRYLIHVSSQPSQTGVYERGKTDRALHLASSTPDDDNCTTWLLPVDARAQVVPPHKWKAAVVPGRVKVTA